MSSGNVYCLVGTVSFSYCTPSHDFFGKSFLTNCIFPALLINYFTSLSRRNKKDYAANSMLKSSKLTMDCWSSQRKDFQRNCTAKEDLSVQLWAPVNELLSEQELILNWSHFPAHLFPHAAESSLNSLPFQAGNGNYLKSLCCGQGLPRILLLWVGQSCFWPTRTEQELRSCCAELPARGRFWCHSSVTG